MKKLINCITIVMLMWACMPGLVSAHAYIAQSTPYQDAELTEAPTSIRITFTEKIDQKLSSISLQRIDKDSKIAGKLSGEDDFTLIYTVPKLEKGIYEVNWQVLSLDTHLTDGSFRFAVGMKLEANKPDETVSLDGNTAGSEGGGASATDKPAATAKPSQVKDPSAKPAATAKPKPATTPTPTPKPAAGTPAAPESGKKTDIVQGQAEAAEDTGSGSEPAADAADNETAATPDAAPESTAEGGPSQQAAPDEAASSHSGHGDFGQSSHAEEGEHNHSGGQGLMVALRVLDILAGVALAGILFFRYAIWRDDEQVAPTGFSLRAERLVLGLAALVWLITGVIRLSMLSDQFGDVTLFALAGGTAIGKIATLRPALALFTLLLAFAPIRERLWANRIKFAAAAALIVTFPLTGHANAAVKDAALAVISHAVHMSAAAIWFGGLAGLFSLTFYSGGMDRLNQAAVRFSLWALPSMAFILISGLWLSASRLSAWGQLLSTAYGRLILAKAVFMLLVLVIAAFHKLVFMPKIAKTGAGRGLLLGIRAEVLLAVALFVLAGWLSSTSPPTEDAARNLSEPFYWHVMGEKAHMSLRISEDDKTQKQAARLDVWLPEGIGAPESVIAVVAPEDQNGIKVTVPLELQPAAAEQFEFPGFTKYTYRASGDFIDDKQKSLITVDVVDAEGNSFRYKREIGGKSVEKLQ